MSQPSILVLALGNDILCDDGVAWHAAREIRRVVDPQRVQVTESSEAGLALIELMTGFERCLILDAIKTGEHPVGSLLEFGPDDFRKIVAPSPHYAGLPEVFDLAGRLDLSMPRRELSAPVRSHEEAQAGKRKAHEGRSPEHARANTQGQGMQADRPEAKAQQKQKVRVSESPQRVRVEKAHAKPQKPKGHKEAQYQQIDQHGRRAPSKASEARDEPATSVHKDKQGEDSGGKQKKADKSGKHKPQKKG